MLIDARKRDILLAGAIGDAVGYLVEFSKLGRIFSDYGHNGLTLDQIHPLSQLTVFDDTQMTLFGLEAIHTGETERHYRKVYKQWLYTQAPPANRDKITSPLAKFASMCKQRAPGMTCLGALNKNEDALPKPINDSKGCGGIMRAAPWGFMDNFEDAFLLGECQARVTHGHPSGYLSAGFFAGLIHLFLYQEDMTLDRAIVACNYYLHDSIDNKETDDAVEKAQRIAKQSTGDHYSDLKRVGEGWVGEEALAVAIYTCYVAKSFEHAIQISINHDGDSDSTGSLAAQLWVAMHGLPEQYRAWESRLDVAEAFNFALDENNYK